MKAGKQHVVPLSPQSMLVLQKIKQAQLDIGTFGANGYLFPNQRSLTRAISDVAISKIIKKINEQHKMHDKPELVDPHMGNKIVTVHGFRSTFRDWAGEVSSHSREVIEHALAHQLKDKAEQAYQRGSLLEKRRALMNDWANFLKD
jgi:integrase